MKRERIWGFLLVAGLLVLWEVSARSWVESPNWPPVSQVLLAIVGYLLNLAMLGAEKRVLHWFQRGGAE